MTVGAATLEPATSEAAVSSWVAARLMLKVLDSEKGVAGEAYPSHSVASVSGELTLEA